MIFQKTFKYLFKKKEGDRHNKMLLNSFGLTLVCICCDFHGWSTGNLFKPRRAVMELTIFLAVWIRHQSGQTKQEQYFLVHPKQFRNNIICKISGEFKSINFRRVYSKLVCVEIWMRRPCSMPPCTLKLTTKYFAVLGVQFRFTSFALNIININM